MEIMSEEEKSLSSETMKETEIWIDLYKFYLDFTLKANAIFYGIAGAVAAFVLSHHGKETFRVLLFALLVPAFLGLILSGLSIYGSTQLESLQQRLEKIMKEFDIYPHMCGHLREPCF